MIQPDGINRQSCSAGASKVPATSRPLLHQWWREHTCYLLWGGGAADMRRGLSWIGGRAADLRGGLWGHRDASFYSGGWLRGGGRPSFSLDILPYHLLWQGLGTVKVSHWKSDFHLCLLSPTNHLEGKWKEGFADIRKKVRERRVRYQIGEIFCDLLWIVRERSFSTPDQNTAQIPRRRQLKYLELSVIVLLLRKNEDAKWKIFDSLRCSVPTSRFKVTATERSSMEKCKKRNLILKLIIF